MVTRVCGGAFYRDYIGVHRDNGKENGNYYLGFRVLGFMIDHPVARLPTQAGLTPSRSCHVIRYFHGTASVAACVTKWVGAVSTWMSDTNVLLGPLSSTSSGWLLEHARYRNHHVAYRANAAAETR